MATFFSGLVIGFINCWQIALITLGTGPFIVAAGGISNIFLHRLAENIQDAYAEAASIAEQVRYFFLSFIVSGDMVRTPYNIRKLIVFCTSNIVNTVASLN